MQDSVSQEIFQPQFHHLSDKQEEVVLSLAQNGIACWNGTCNTAKIRHHWCIWFHLFHYNWCHATTILLQSSWHILLQQVQWITTEYHFNIKIANITYHTSILSALSACLSIEWPLSRHFENATFSADFATLLPMPNTVHFKCQCKNVHSNFISIKILK